MSVHVNLIGVTFGDLLVKKRDGESDQNIKYIVKCKCGYVFSTYGFQLKNKKVTCCRFCRKLINKQKNKKKNKKRNIKNQKEIRYTLMDEDRTKILKGRLGQYLFFDLDRAHFAAQCITDGACVVILEKAKELVK